jgi:hypothetical protein
MQPDSELLHRVSASVAVARDIIDRSTTLCGRAEVSDETRLLAGLTDAADALSFVASVLEEELRRRTSLLGPAA